MNMREYHLLFRHLIQADLALVDTDAHTIIFVFFTNKKHSIYLGKLAVSSATTPISAMKSQTSKGRARPETWMLRAAVVHGR